jgi:hypothetical protein
VKPAPERRFFADRAPAASISQLDTQIREGDGCLCEAKLPGLTLSGGSSRLPSTTNALKRFFRGFQRFYATRGGFHSVLSAKRELLLLLVVYVFTQQATTSHAPIKVIVPEARRMLLYRVINDPLRALQEWGAVKPTGSTADLLVGQAAAA